jgi:hypothetical protein
VLAALVIGEQTFAQLGHLALTATITSAIAQVHNAQVPNTQRSRFLLVDCINSAILRGWFEYAGHATK